MGDWRATCWRHVTVVLACFLNHSRIGCIYLLKFRQLIPSRDGVCITSPFAPI